MYLLYEEGGEFRVGTVLSRAPASFQIETPHGRRAKVKSAAVLLTFERPGAPEHRRRLIWLHASQCLGLILVFLLVTANFSSVVAAPGGNNNQRDSYPH